MVIKVFSWLLRYVALAGLLALISMNLHSQCITIQGGPLEVDTYFSTIFPDSNERNYQTEFLASQWTYNSVPGEVRSTLKFDLSFIPAGSVITSALLSLYAEDSNYNGRAGQPMFGSNNACYLERLTAPWNVNTVTWNTQPSYNTTGQVLLPRSTSTSQDYPNIDITPFAQFWQQNPGTNYGMMLKMITSSYLNSMVFCASQNADSAKRPKLVICYTPASCTITDSFNFNVAGGGVVQFNNLSSSVNGIIASWSFSNSSGQFSSSSQLNPQITFTGLPPYSATLVVRDSINGNCSDSLTLSVNVTTTCITIQPGAPGDIDSYFGTIFPDSNSRNFPTEFLASQWTYNTVPGEVRGIVKFDLSFIPPGSVITSALLSLYADDSNYNGRAGQPMFGPNNACYLERVTSTWNVNTITWNNQPPYTTTGQVLLPQSTSATEDYLNLDITQFAQFWGQNPGTNYGMMLRMITSAHLNSMVFCASGNPDSLKRPKLEICYIPAPCNIIDSFSFNVSAGGVVQFNNASTSANGIISSWTFSNASGQFSSSSGLNPQITFSGQPPYTVTLVVSDSLNPTCHDSITVPLNISNCITLQPGSSQDANQYIGSILPNSNGGNGVDVFSAQWTYNSIPGEVRGLIKFDLSAIPAGSLITSASLSLYANTTNVTTTNGYPGQPTYGSANASYLERITSAWSQAGVTWNTQPTYTSTGEVLLPQSTSTAEDYSNLDVTQFVQLWVQNPAVNYGMMLKMIGSAHYNDMVFCSSTHPDSAKRPKLEICYIPNSAICAAAFTYNNSNDSVWFYNQSFGITTGLLWNFGDGGSSTQMNPLHVYAQNGSYPVVLTVQDSLLGGCSDSVIINVVGIHDDTLCGLVFKDVNGDGIYDSGDSPYPGAEVLIDGVAYPTDSTGFYRVRVGGGSHTVSAVLPGGWIQTSPLNPSDISITLGNYEYVCGLDFGLKFAPNGIDDINSGSNKLIIFPNPSSGASFNVIFPSDYNPSNSSFIVSDVLGQEVSITGIEKNTAYSSVSLNEPGPGIYTIMVKYLTAEGQSKHVCAKLLVLK